MEKAIETIKSYFEKISGIINMMKRKRFLFLALV